jgi:hypothetical protein
MADFAVLELAIRRNTVLAATVCLILTAATAVSMGFTFAALGNANDISLRMPVLVVPGAVGGVYSPGITEDNVRTTARYLATLVTNFSGIKSFHERFEEFETYAAAPFIPALQRARAELQRDVDTQNQSRTFFATTGTEQMRQTNTGGFDYFVKGERIVYASGIPMETRISEIHLRLHLGSPSRRNPTGILLDGFEVKDTAPPATVDATIAK